MGNTLSAARSRRDTGNARSEPNKQDDEQHRPLQAPCHDSTPANGSSATGSTGSTSPFERLLDINPLAPLHKFIVDPAAITTNEAPKTDTTSPRAQLRQEILALAEPHRTTTKQPPFSAGELIVMALVCRETESVDTANIMHWIVRHFKYYGSRAPDEYAKHMDDGNMRWKSPKVVVNGFNAAFCEYDSPLKQISGAPTSHTSGFSYSIETAAARLYLRNHLTEKQKGTFPFLRLPAELRNHIYELVFRHAEGLSIDNDIFGRLIMLVQHHDDNSYAKDCWGEKDFDLDLRKLPPIQEILPLLSVGKQVHGEALPYFYQLNPLHVKSFKKLTALVRQMHPSRLKHLSDLSIDLDGYHRYHSDAESFGKFPETVKALRSIKQLKKLEIKTNDVMWLPMAPTNRQKMGRKTPFKKFAQIPGMKDFAELVASVGSFKLRGEAPELQKYLDSKIESINARSKQDEAKGAKSGKGNKRKATSEDASGSSGARKRTRRATERQPHSKMGLKGKTGEELHGPGRTILKSGLWRWSFLTGADDMECTARRRCQVR